MTLRTRFTLGFLTLALLLGSIQLLLIYHDACLMQRFDTLVGINITESQQAARSSLLIQRIKSNLRELMLELPSGQADEIKHAQTAIEQSLTELARIGQSWHQAVQQDPASSEALGKEREQEELETLTLYLDQQQRFITQSYRILQAALQGEAFEVLHQRFETELEAGSRELQTQVEQLWLQTQQQTRIESQQFHAALWDNFTLALWISGSMALLALLLGLWYADWITRSLRALVEGIGELGQGRFALPLPVRGHDEIALLTHTFNQLAQNLQHNIQQREQVEQTLRQTNHELDTVIEQIPSMVFIKEAEGLRFIRLNKACEQILGYREQDLLGRTVHDFFPKEQADFFTQKDREALASPEVCVIEEEAIETPMGAKFLQARKIAIRDKQGKPQWLLGIAHDITEAKALKDQLHQLATYDALTGLLNRRMMEQQLATAFSGTRRDDGEFSLLILDLDRFKNINDQYGHQTGDAVLQAFAQTLQNGLRQQDKAGRYGGEEFIVLLPATTLADARHLAERLRQQIARITIPRPADDRTSTAPISASIGVASHRHGDTATSVEVVIRHADQALYHAKQQGRNRVSYYDKGRPQVHPGEPIDSIVG